jgi:hypothetical protein
MPQILEEAPVAASREDRHLSFARRAAKTAFRFVIILVLAGVIGVSWYLARKGFSRQWRYQVTQELHKRGVEASIGRLTLDPFRGLIARDVRIFSYRNRANRLALINEVALDINYAALFHHQPFLNALDVRNAQITIPLRSPDGTVERPQLKNFYAHMYFPPEQIYLSQAEGIFCGVRISATGQLIKRANYQPSAQPTEEEWQQRLSMFRQIVTELQKLSFPGAPPSLQIKFSGDLAQLEDARAEATLRAERVRRKNYEMRDFLAAAEWSDQTLKLTQFEWKDNLGSFAAQAGWSRQTNAANFQVRSSIDLKTLMDAAGLGHFLAAAAFNSPPVVDFSGSTDLISEHLELKVIGRVSVASFTLKNVPLSDLRAEFSWDGERAWLHDLRVRHENGELRADIFDAPDDFRLNIDGPVTPGELRPFVSPEVEAFIDQWECPRPATVQLAIRGHDRHPENWHGDGTIALQRARFRGVWMNSASSKIHFADGAVSYDNLRVTRDEGVGSGSFTYDFAEHEVRISNIKSTLRPVDAVFWIDPDLWKAVMPYKFHQAPAITANGIYQFHGGKGTKLDITVDAPAGMDYVFIGKTLPFDRIAAKLLFTTDRLQIVDLNGVLFSGAVRGKSDISLARNDQRYHASLNVAGTNFAPLTDLYFNYKTAQGQLSGSYDFDGVGGDPRKMRGRGRVEVTNGNVFAIPVFGPLSAILNFIVPGAGYSIAHDAGANFTLKDSVIHTDDFEVSGKLFSMLGHGDVYFLDDKLDFEVRINGKGPGALLIPVYKLFEYKGEGSLKQPDWHPKRF